MIQSGIETAARTPSLGRALMIGLAFWLLLAPGDDWTWVIVGGQELREHCEELRKSRLDGDYLVCVSVDDLPRIAEEQARQD